MIGVLSIVCGALAAPIAIENGAIRIEVDPELFSVCYVGFPAGRNFVEPLHVDAKTRTRGGAVDPGGLRTGVIPHPGEEAALLRGPGEILEHTDRSIVLLGPQAEALPIRFKKAVRIHERAARAWYTVTLMASAPIDHDVALRNLARVPLGGALRFGSRDATIPLLGAGDPASAFLKQTPEGWCVDVPPQLPAKNVVVGAFVTELIHQNALGTWRRRVEGAPDDVSRYPESVSLVCLLDTASAQYVAAFQGPFARLAPAAPLTMTEVWDFRPSGE